MMTTKVSAPSPEEWKRYEKSLRERKKFIESYRAEIEMKPIKTENSLQAGDHLVREGNCSGPSTYYHHMLCTSVDNNKITVIHYTGPWSPGTSDLLSCIFCKDSGFFGKVCEEDITFLKLMKDKVMKVIWPDALKRFSVKKVIENAKNRIGENSYSLFENNCEHFVTWCICGLKVSLQVKWWHQPGFEVLKSVGVGLINLGENKSLKALLFRLLANLSDETINIFTDNFLVVYGVGIIMEVLWALHELNKDPPFAKDKEEFNVERVEIVSKVLGRVIFGIAGSVYCGPLGGFIGAGLGHSLGFGAGWLYKHRESFVEKLRPNQHSRIKRIQALSICQN